MKIVKQLLSDNFKSLQEASEKTGVNYHKLYRFVHKDKPLKLDDFVKIVKSCGYKIILTKNK